MQLYTSLWVCTVRMPARIGASSPGYSGVRVPCTIHEQLHTLRGEDLAYGNRRLPSRVSHKHWNRLYQDLLSSHPGGNSMELCPQRSHLQVSRTRTHNNEHPMGTREIKPGTLEYTGSRGLRVALSSERGNDSVTLHSLRSGGLRLGHFFVLREKIIWQP
jgi:hypothetical protein